MIKLYLASQSPRRADLLAQIGASFTRLAPAVDETPKSGEAPAAFVARLAAEKAAAGMALVTPENAQELAVVLGADTIVVQGEKIFGKPRDRADFIAMQAALSDRQHEVLTAVELLCAKEPFAAGEYPQAMHRLTALSSTKVRFKPLAASEVEKYWNTGEPQGKAGGYAIQGAGALLVESMQGSYSGVVGLPLYETGRLLAQAGVATILSG